MKLTLPEPPSANRYWRHAKGRTYLSPEALQYRQDVAAICLPKRLEKIAGPLVMSVVWYRGIVSGDLDNRLKQLGDALRGYAYTDDAQVVEIHAYRVDRPRKPGVEVTLFAKSTTEDR